ncbi:unnamed protein product [Amaranthus hypochondriacus]
MADQEPIANGFIQTQIIGSNEPPLPKKKRNLPGNPDPEAEVIALSPKTLMATNRFLCEICGKGFQRDQNLQLHRRGHNLPWKLKQRSGKEPKKRVYVCPEKTCVHHHPSRALGDLTGIKKHFFRKHGEKKWKCEKCNKKYAVQSDWKAHSKTCGTREYKCDCGTIFSRRDSFITHRAFCDALAEETARMNAANAHFNLNTNNNLNYPHLMGPNLGPAVAMAQHFSSIFRPLSSSSTKQETLEQPHPNPNQRSELFPLWFNTNNTHQLTQTLQKPLINTQTIPFLVPEASKPQPHFMNWDFGNKLISDNLQNINNNNIPNTTSFPSLYSTNQNPQTNSSSNSSQIMSATALLQKAAQMGSTSSTPTNHDQFFLGNFGLVMKGNDHDINIDYNNDNNNVGGGGGCGSLFGTSNSSTTNVGSDIEGSVDDLSTMTTIYHASANNNNPAKRQKLFNEESHVDCITIQGIVGVGGQTRDFLGVESQPAVCRPSSINGWI